MTGGALGLLVGDLGLAEANPDEQPLGVALLLAQLPKGIDALAVEQTEVAHIAQHIVFGELLQQPIEPQRQFASEP